MTDGDDIIVIDDKLFKNDGSGLWNVSDAEPTFPLSPSEQAALAKYNEAKTAETGDSATEEAKK